MTYRVLIEPTAERGIREAFHWIAEHQSPDTAASWYNALEKKVQTLQSHPHRCPVAAESDKFAEEIRELLHGTQRQKYRILFTIRQDTVHVLYVRHGAQDEIRP
jgi:plasmid stabilization system protein ParE